MTLKVALITVFLLGVGVTAFAVSLPEVPTRMTTYKALETQAESLRYVLYDPQRFAQLAHQRRVLFFRASWCSTCTQAEQELSAQSSMIPSNMTVLEVDYDKEKSLRQRYAVVNQHTFVQVDESGNMVALWNGGGVSELLQNTR